MDLKKELLEFVEANNWFSLEGRKNAEGVIDSYLKSYNKQLTLTDVRRSVSYGHLLHYIEIQDSDIATIEALHDLLLDTHGYWVDFIALKRARELTAKMYKALY